MSAKPRIVRNRVRAYARPAGLDTRIERMIAATRALEFVVTRTETEALLLEANLIKRLRPRFNVLAARRQVVPLYPDHVRSLGAADPQASRRAHPAGPLFRAVRFGLGGQPHHQRAAARVSAALVQRSVLREPHAAVPACIRSSAARRRAPTRSTSASTRCWCAKPMRSCPAAARRSRTSLPARWKRRRRRSISSAPRFTATAWRRCQPSRRTRASIRAASRRPTSLRCISRAALPASRCSSSAPGRTGAIAPISPRPTGRSRPAKSSPRSSRSSMTTSRCPRLILISHDIEDRELLAEALATKSGHKIEVMVPRRGEKKDLIEHALANAREALGPQARRNVLAAAAVAPARRDLRLAAGAAAHRGLRQQPHPGLQRGRRHDRRRTGRLPQKRLPQVQHPLGRSHSRRRLRHDARSADAPLQAADGGSAARDHGEGERERSRRRYRLPIEGHCRRGVARCRRPRRAGTCKPSPRSRTNRRGRTWC